MSGTVCVSMASLGLIMTLNRDINTILYHQSVYQYLEEDAPYLMALIHKKDHQKWGVLIHEVSNILQYVTIT